MFAMTVDEFLLSYKVEGDGRGGDMQWQCWLKSVLELCHQHCHSALGSADIPTWKGYLEPWEPASVRAQLA